ncbi:ABC transporter permease [Nostoc sp. UCD121]|uniref:ABC transporter permease subunit n=1 Tax=unclassified Nostoc TaxID=2593658 RepID=UPI00162A4E56|nr:MULTISPECIES: ABC transporter permease subunit [unclassified Nostoc]MBC1224617.1 ABC transporter permease [Nostoc sp. UCD120]MBC1277440.1 ABC transporter permease [Nostoc sp. UCD121]MBC1296121.1 ABC transporter permease [Nostoc sp. UCD122]
MMPNFIDKIGDWNPQLLRELKGRLKFFNVAIAVATSLLLQLVVFLYQLREFPDDQYSLTNTYCRLSQVYKRQQNQTYQQSDQYPIPDLNDLLAKNICPQNQIDWQLWWRDHWEYIFLTLSVIFVFTLLVAGTYLLINDLAKEESRGTLNFIRLSPQSETSILTGKLLGVPSLVYLVILVAVPLHLLAGRSAEIAFSYILSYYAILVASCIFFYSAALLFGLISRLFSGFQPWLGSGAVLLFLFTVMGFASSSSSNILNNSTAWIRLFAPWDTINYLFPNLLRVYNGSQMKNLEFFYLPLGTNVVVIVGFHLLNLGLCSYGILQALKRSFRNPQASIINKGQSYVLVAFCQIMMWGFTLQSWSNSSNFYEQGESNLVFLAIYNLGLLLSLIAILSPHRQDVQDWARYRHQEVSSRKSVWRDLIWSEKSPALVAIAINLAIVTIPLLVWISITSVFDTDYTQNGASDNFNSLKVLLAVALSISIIMIYATIAQLILLLKTPKRSFWAIGTIGTVTFLPPMILEFLGISSWKHPTVWLFSPFPWSAIQYSGVTTIFMAFVAQLSVLALLNFQLTKQVRLAGESATKALLAGR